MAATVRLRLTGPMDQLRIVWQTGEALLDSVPLGVDPEGEAYNFLVALQEIVTNVLRHAYEEDENRPLEVVYECHHDRFVVRVRDNGEPFNPLEFETTSVELENDEMPQQAGGYGIMIARAIMDDVAYTRDGDWNELALTKAIGVPAATATSSNGGC